MKAFRAEWEDKSVFAVSTPNKNSSKGYRELNATFTGRLDRHLRSANYEDEPSTPQLQWMQS